MFSDDSTDFSSSSDETSEAACLYLSCTSPRCYVQKTSFSECLTSDTSSQRLHCPICREKYKLKVVTETHGYRVFIELEGGGYIDCPINGTLSFPEDWNSFYIDRVH